jgi:DNA repair protein RecO (recombination protein O)
MTLMSSNNLYQDEVIVLKVKDWQTADRLAEGFSRAHGRISFIAYGARYMRNRSGALVQSLTHASMHFSPGRKFDTLRQLELLEPLVNFSEIDKLAYAAFIAELTAELTPEREPQENIYMLLRGALQILNRRNPRIVCLSFALKLLALCGVAPSLDACVCCGAAIDGDAYISAVQGGSVCGACKTGAEAPFLLSARELCHRLLSLDLAVEEGFSVKGKDLLVLEEFLHKFIFVQVEKPLKSLQFLREL